MFHSFVFDKFDHNVQKWQIRNNHDLTDWDEKSIREFNKLAALWRIPAAVGVRADWNWN